MKRLRCENGGVDAIDRQILAALFKDARLPIATLARRVGLSAPSVTERVRRLEEAGVIAGYTIAVNPEALGLPLSVLLRIRPVPGEIPAVAAILRDLPEVVEVDRVTGEDCFVARAHVRSVEHMEALIDRLTERAMTNTSVIQSSPVRRRPPLGVLDEKGGRR